MTPDVPFDITVSSTGDTVLAALAGEVDLAAEATVLHEVTAALDADPEASSLRVDLTAVSFLDSSGLRALIQLKQLADDRALSCTVAVTDGAVARLFELTGLLDYFTFDPPRSAS